MVTTFTAIGQILGGTHRPVAASFGTSTQGYDLAFLGIGMVGWCW
jgi:hypothetical protein